MRSVFSSVLNFKKISCFFMIIVALLLFIKYNRNYSYCDINYNSIYKRFKRRGLFICKTLLSLSVFVWNNILSCSGQMKGFMVREVGFESWLHCVTLGKNMISLVLFLLGIK